MSEHLILRGNGGAYQKQTPFTELLLPVLQIGVALLAVGLAAFSYLVFMWLLEQTAALLIFWPVAVFFAWRNDKIMTITFIALALGALAAVFLLFWPLHPRIEAWTYLRICLVPITAATPYGCYRLAKRMLTDALHPNLEESVRARSGELVDKGLFETIQYKPEEEEEETFDWS